MKAKAPARPRPRRQSTEQERTDRLRRRYITAIVNTITTIRHPKRLLTILASAQLMQMFDRVLPKPPAAPSTRRRRAR